MKLGKVSFKVFMNEVKVVVKRYLLPKWSYLIEKRYARLSEKRFKALTCKYTNSRISNTSLKTRH